MQKYTGTIHISVAEMFKINRLPYQFLWDLKEVICHKVKKDCGHWS